jgi:enterochelin esterase-like enzyme
MLSSAGRSALILAALAISTAPAAAAVPGDELPPERDNGAQGRGPHAPPTQACGDVVSARGSRILRVLPAGPETADGRLAFTSGVCVYLPPGYASGKLRYPVVYLLHGGGGDQADWVALGSIQEKMDEAYGRDPRDAAIVVMPDGSDPTCWCDLLDRPIWNEQYVLRWLIPYVDMHFRTVASRSGRSIVGLSNGGHGALMLAAKAPQLFAAAGSMSGNVAWKSFQASSELYLDKSTGETSLAYYHGQLPIDLAENLDGLDLVLDIGASCSGDATQDACGTFVFEQTFLQDNRDLVARLRTIAHAGEVDYRESEGGHAWRWWTRWLCERQLPFLLARMADPTPTTPKPSPTRFPFRYRSVSTAFDVNGYRVAVVRRVREFLDLDRVTPDGLTVTGSGSASIETAPVYRPGARYRVSGWGGPPRALVADGAGRLHLQVDLGPSHDSEQYSPQAEAQARLSGQAYWTQRTIEIRRER